MGIYNIDKIESWYNDFSSIKNKYINGYYRDYQNSYLKRCGDSYVVSMRNNLNKRYEKIKEMYIKIDRYWSDYINDVKNTDNRLAGRGGGINVASIAYKINSLPILQEYNDGSVSLVMNINNTYSKYSYEIENLFSQTGAVCNRVMATATLLVTSVKEGLVKLLEMAGDLIIIVGAVQCAIYTGAVDLYNNATGNKSNYTEQLWDETRAIVSVDNTKMIFDDFYDKTFVGSWIKSNAYGFDSIREVGCEVGEVIGVAALSIVTGGGGAVMYGAVKATEHTEENWQDPETSTFVGLAKGSIRGVMDGVMYALGAKGDVVMKKAATKAVEAGGKTILKKAGILAGKMAFEVGCSFTQDFSNIFIDSAFSNNKIVDSNGNTIEFSNFKEKLNYYYNEAGGSKQLLMSAGTAMILSGLSDAIDLNKIGKNVSGLDDVRKINSSNYNDIKVNEGKLNIYEISENNGKILKENILSKIDDNYNDIQKARKIYIELNKNTNYNVDYYLSDDTTKEKILDKVTTFNNLTDSNVICKGWSELYADALISSGIDPNRVNVVKAQKGTHWWVEIDMDDYIVRADATEAFLGMTDLANCKFGDPTVGFLLLDKNSAGVRINNKILADDPSIIEYSKGYFKEVDKSIEYINDAGYFSEQVKKLQSSFSEFDSPYYDVINQNDIITEKIKGFTSMEVPTNMNGYDAFAYYRKFSNTLFGQDNVYAKPKLKKVNIDGKTYSAVEIFITDGDNNKYFMTFDEINGKKIYTADEYIKGPINNYENFK